MLNGYYFFNFRDFLLQDLLDAHFQSHLSHCSAVAGAGQFDLDSAVILDIHEFDIAPVTLQHRAYLVQYFCYFLFIHYVLLVMEAVSASEFSLS